MYRIVPMGFLLLIVLAPVPAQAGKVEKDLLALQQEWVAARVRGDVAFLEKFYAQGFWMTTTTGAVVERDAAIAMWSSQSVKPEAITDEDVKVLVDGLTAIVIGRENVKGGARGDHAVRFTNIFVRRQKTWKLLTHHATLITDDVGVSH